MDDSVKKIFVDAGAIAKDIELIEKAAAEVAATVRAMVVDASAIAGPEMELPVRVLLCRVIHADMEKAFKQFRTIDG